MKHVKTLTLALCLVTLAGCAGTPLSGPEKPRFPVIGTDWLLLEVQRPLGPLSLDRLKLMAEGQGDTFSLRFTGEDQVSGRADPNLYAAPCSWGDDNTLGIGLAAVTKMLSLREPGALREEEFFDYLSRVSRWSKDGEDLLELHGENEEGGRVILVFIAASSLEEQPQGGL
jgi:heat shock protein HslJ